MILGEGIEGTGGRLGVKSKVMEVCNVASRCATPFVP